MSGFIAKYRLASSSLFTRTDENEKKAPKRMIILSVEGDLTERTYFKNLNNYLDDSIIQVEVLSHRRGDGYSSPDRVIELLQEYIAVREGELLPEELNNVPELKPYKQDFVEKYLNNPQEIPKKERDKFKSILMNLGIDIDYRKYLNSFQKNTDVFAVVLDRDRGGRTDQLLQSCYEHCKKKQYGFFITNPCFEFWLLLHLCDVRKEYSDDDLCAFLENKKCSNHHTVVSYEVSKRAEHAKNISSDKFEKYYYHNIMSAIEHSKQFATKIPQIFDSLGTNLPELISKIFDDMKKSGQSKVS